MGKQIPVLGQISWPIHLNNVLPSHRFTVVPSDVRSGPLLLGLDFLNTRGLQICFDHGVVKLTQAKTEVRINVTCNSPTDISMQVDCEKHEMSYQKTYLPPDCTITSTNMRLSLYNKEYMAREGIAKLHLRNPKNQKKSILFILQ